MVSKRKPIKKRDPNQITIPGILEEDPSVTVARAVLQPELQAAGTLKQKCRTSISCAMNSTHLSFVNKVET